MIYDQSLSLRDGRTLRIRNAKAEDAKKVCALFSATHGQTDFLLAYPEENRFTVQQEADFLTGLLNSPREVMLLAEVDGQLAGCASVCKVGDRYKLLHRAEFGISVDQSFWGLGIGWALTQAAIECAKAAQYSYLELSVVSENIRAVRMYEKAGFKQFGLHPQGFRSKYAGYQPLIFMGMELENP